MWCFYLLLPSFLAIPPTPPPLLPLSSPSSPPLLPPSPSHTHTHTIGLQGYPWNARRGWPRWTRCELINCYEYKSLSIHPGSLWVYILDRYEYTSWIVMSIHPGSLWVYILDRYEYTSWIVMSIHPGSLWVYILDCYEHTSWIVMSITVQSLKLTSVA